MVDANKDMFQSVLVGVLVAFVAQQLISSLDFGTDTLASTLMPLLPGLIGVVVIVALVGDIG